MIRAIETQYKGYRFRSRLEARWGVFFDRLGVRWDYESEGYAAGAVAYLPDFRVSTTVGLVVRARSLAERFPDPAARPFSDSQVARWDDDLSVVSTDGPISAFVEVKPNAEPDKADIGKCAAFVKESGSALLVAFGDPYDMNLSWMAFNPGYCIGRSAIVASKGPSLHVLVQGAGCDRDEFFLVASQFRPEILPAMIAARSARFEHGEAA